MHPQSGLDFLDRVSRESALQSIPVVIISSTAPGTDDEGECLKHGAVNFIRRPIEPEALLAEVAKTLREAKPE
jgi:CheY-like chemotaxis protein